MADKVRLLDVRRVTHGYGNHEHPVFSPDGKQLAFYAGDYGYIQIHVAGADGRGQRPLTCAHGNHTQPAWSPDGRWVYYRHQPANDAPWEIWRVDVVQPETKERLLADPRWSYKHPSPSPDGQWLVWFSDQGTPAHFHLFRARMDDGQVGAPERLTHDANRNDCHPTWSRDGAWIAFHAYLGAENASQSHIFVCDAAGGQVRQISDGEAYHKHPFFVGRDLVLHHTEEPDGRRFVALRRFADGELLARLTSGKKNDKHPSPYVPARGPVRIAFSSKKRGSEAPDELDATYDVFWGTLTGITVRR